MGASMTGAPPASGTASMPSVTCAYTAVPSTAIADATTGAIIVAVASASPIDQRPVLSDQYAVPPATAEVATLVEETALGAMSGTPSMVRRISFVVVVA